MKRIISSAACGVFLLVACAEPVAPRSTVQADAIAKSDLEGVWYFRQTVVGVPFTTGFTFIGEQGENEMEKIVWDIQEDVLTARRAYEYVKGSEKGEPSQQVGPDGKYLGAPVAAFKIKSQFDIIREYNPSTGEEYDKVVESTERKWFDRKFIRVDWSENLVTNFQFLADYSTGSVTSIKQDPTRYYVSDPKDPDAFRIERANDKAQANYLELTQKLTASPEMVTFDDGTSWPLCYLEYATQDCGSQEIKVRSSFLRVTPRDYEPMVYDDHMMDRFGYFTLERKSYNRQYGLTESGRVRLINRHNIWQHSLTEKACKVDNDCAPLSAGVRCVTETPLALSDKSAGAITGVCALPFAVRNLQDPTNPASADLGPRPIVYYVNDSFPPDLKDAAKELARQYDETFRGIYRGATGKEAPGSLFVMCTNNPVQQGDPTECGPAGTHARAGDIRYNTLYWVDEPNSAQLLGYGPNSNDPETGEVISSSAFIYGAAVDSYAAFARDLVKLVNGEIKPDKFLDGVNVKAWVEANRYGSTYRQVSDAEVADIASRMDTGWVKGLPKTNAIKKGNVATMRQNAMERRQMLNRSQMLGADIGLTARRLSKLAGTQVEKQLVNGEILLTRGIDPRSGIGQADMTKVRPLSSVSPEAAKFIRAQRRRLSAHSVDMASTIDDNVLGFALAQQGKDSAEVWRKIRELVFLSTALHEVGHTLGLRHNFAGSYDPMNYPKTYWDLRTANGTKQPRPRYMDPESQTELQGVALPKGLKAGISEFMQSSIMDYGAGFNSDIQGLGKYDRAALKFGYGQLVEVFNTTKDPYLLGALQASVTYGEPQPLLIDCSGNNFISVHYTKLPTLVDLEARTDVAMSSIKPAILSPTCAYPDSVEVDPSKRVVVPYKFCSDEFEGASPGCAMFDRGADVYEVASNAMSSYRHYYIFDNFKRDRLGFNPDEYMYRLYTRYFDELRSQMQFYVLDRAVYEDSTPDDGKPTNFWRSPDGWGPFTVAVSNGYDFFGEVLMTPEPGPYYQYEGADGRTAYYMDDYGSGKPAFDITIADGRYFQTMWDYDSGYYWYDKVRVVGSFLDKVAAIGELTDPETYFMGKDLAADLRQYSINYYRLYAKQTQDLFAGALTDRWDQFGWIWDGTKVTRRPISGTMAPLKANEVPLDPTLGFTVQLWMASLGVALLPATFDSTFYDSSRLWLAGNGAQISPSLPTVTYTDAPSGKVYTAVSFKNGAVETGVAARMIARANELKAKNTPVDPYVDAELKNYTQLMESLRSITEVYSNEVY